MVSAPYSATISSGFTTLPRDFAHLLAALAQDHTVARALGVRLLGGNNADIVQELVPEAGVQQVQRGMFHAAVIPVDRRPVFERFLACKRLIVVRIHIAQEVPG